jgi:hydrogenase maturation protein HypF
VTIEAEGPKANVSRLIEKIFSDGPPNAQILSLDQQDLSATGENGFSIISSRGNGELSLMVAPDTAICLDCLREINDPSDRRFRYPFNSCVNCGPRYTIVEDVPFDRETTSMRVFPMCKACLHEYRDPNSRRFHSQTNSCWECGPRLWLADKHGKEIPCGDAALATVNLLKEGKIVAIRGLGGFHLAANAEDDVAVKLLRARKKRPTKPFAIMSARLEDIESYARVTAQERAMLESRLAPIVLLQKRKSNSIAESVALNNSTLGVMLAYTPLHSLLLSGKFRALVMTSGNLSEEPIKCSVEDAIGNLAHIADYFLLHNREIVRRCDDSIVKFYCGNHTIMRRARGYVPKPIVLERPLKPICAYGAHLKNTICVAKGSLAYVSRYVGDLDNLETVEYLEETVVEMEKLLSVRPGIVACDMHPDYASTKLARERAGVRLHEVQHHHAHIVSCAVENGVYDKVIGVAFDGAGLGVDGAVWGSEFMIADAAGYRRVAHLKYFPMPGGEAVVREPYRMAISYLFGMMGDSVRALPLDVIQKTDDARLSALLNMMRRNDNSPPTSGMGRLFDAVAAMLGLCLNATFEGEGPVYLESVAAPHVNDFYEFSLERLPRGNRPIIPLYQRGSDGDLCEQTLTINPEPVLEEILADIQKGVGVPVIAARFHNAVIRMVVNMCSAIRKDTGLESVALSGGVFQNTYLLERLTASLSEHAFTALTHKSLSPNDECISFGQAVIANEREV